MRGGIDADLSAFPKPPPGAEGEASPSAAAEPKKPEEAAVLRFLDPAAVSGEAITLDFPFEWEGREVRTLTPRRLSYAEVMAVYEAAKTADGEVSLVEFYGAMVGLPAAVLRGMEDGDARAVIGGCFPFLPRSMRAEISPSTSGTSGASG